MPTRDSQGISKVEFGPFRLDAAKRVLWRDGRVVPLPPKALDVLVALVEQRGDVVTKDELLKRVWPDTFVEEANLSVNVSALRKALGDGPGGRPFVSGQKNRAHHSEAATRHGWRADLSSMRRCQTASFRFTSATVSS